jgi:hypothetical protein
MPRFMKWGCVVLILSVPSAANACCGPFGCGLFGWGLFGCGCWGWCPPPAPYCCPPPPCGGCGMAPMVYPYPAMSAPVYLSQPMGACDCGTQGVGTPAPVILQPQVTPMPQNTSLRTQVPAVPAGPPVASRSSVDPAPTSTATSSLKSGQWKKVPRRADADKKDSNFLLQSYEQPVADSVPCHSKAVPTAVTAWQARAAFR